MNKIMPLRRALAGKVCSVLKRRNDGSSAVPPPTSSYGRQDCTIRLLSTMSLTLLLLLSIPALALKAYSYSFIESNVEMGFYLVNDENQMAVQGETLVSALPRDLFRVPEKIVLVVAMLSILLSMAHLTFVAWDWKAGKRTQTGAFRRIAVVLHAINAIMVLVALTAISVSHKASSTFESDLIPKEPNAVSPSGYRYYRYDAGTFDLETWTCELMKPKMIGDARKDYRAQCEIEMAGRMIMIPFLLVALAIVGLSVWALVAGGKHGTHSEHIYTKDIDIELGDGPEDSKRAQVEQVELATLQRPDKQKDGRLSKIEEDGEEAEEAARRASAVAKVVESGALPAENKIADAKKSEGGS